MIITRKSTISGAYNSKDIPVDPEDMALWQLGEGNIQDLMPYLTAEDREFILSGITSVEWEEFFSKEIA